MPIAPDSPELARPTKRGRRMSELAALDEVHLRPCATDLGVLAEVPAARVAAVQAEGRRPVLASGCGAVSTFLAEPTLIAHAEDIGRHNAVDKSIGGAGRAVSGTPQRHGAGAAGAD
jgi:hypothetical protein